MSRCRICDWSPTVGSDYYQGLAAKGRNRRLVLDNNGEDTICTSCATVIAIDLASRPDPLRTYDAWAKDSEGKPQSWEEYMERK